MLAGIDSEEAYQQHKSKLQNDVLNQASQFRYDFFKHSVAGLHPIETIKIAPEWLLSATTTSIRPTVRISNIFEREGIVLVKDLLQFSESEMMDWQYFGRKSLNDLSKMLIEAIEHPPCRGEQLHSFSLYEHLQAALRTLPEKPREILMSRLGADGRAPLTLQKLGELFDVTRERIRQIEKKYLDKIIREENWDDLILKKISDLRRNRTEPLYLDLLAAEDDWFCGFDGEDLFLKEIIDRFSKGTIKAFEVDGRWIFSQVDQDRYASILKIVLSQIKDGVDHRLTKSEVESLVETVCLGHGVPELSSTVLDSIGRRLHFACIEGEQLLVSIGHGLDHYVSIVLSEAKTPLHYNQIHERVAEIYDTEVDIRRVQRSLISNPEAYIYNRGVYGSLQHFEILDDEASDIVEIVEHIFAQGTPYRQWHSSEILRMLIDQDAPALERLNICMIDIILSRSDRVTYLSKHIWTSSDYSNNADRIQVRDAIISVLKDANGPLTLKEIKTKVSEYRGVNTSFQISPDDVLVRVSSSQWGLMHRDLPCEKTKIDGMIDSLHDHLTMKDKAYHISELDDLLLGNESEFSISSVIMSFALTDHRLKTWNGGLIGLSTWEEPRRHNRRTALDLVISGLVEATHFDQIHEEFIRLLERDVPRDAVSGLLSLSAISYNNHTGMWEPPSELDIKMSHGELEV